MSEPAEDRTPDKVFVISLHRTMTRSTDALLSMSGLRTVHWPKSFQGQDLQEAVKGQEGDLGAVYASLAPVLAHYDAFSDVPFPVLYPQLARDYPEAKFVLVHRDPRAWANSVREHIQGRELKPFEKVQYWTYWDQPIRNLRGVSEGDLVRLYFDHLFAVSDFFEQRGELDRICFVGIEDPEIGPKICRFLGLPPREFPRIVGGQTGLETVREWLRSAPEKPDPHRVLVQVLSRQRDLVGAIAAARDLVRTDPENPNTHRILTRLLERAGRSEEAAAAAEKAVRAGTRSPALHRKAGFKALKRGRAIRALVLFLKVVRLKWARFREKRGGILPQ